MSIVSVELLEARTLLSGTPVAFGQDAPASVRFIDADGTDVVVGIRGGAGVIDFNGAIATQTRVHGTLVLTGTGLSINQINVNAEAAGARLAIRSRGGDGVVDLGDVDVSGRLLVLSAPTAHLNGQISSSGDMYEVVLGAAKGTISDGGSALPLNVVIYGGAEDLFVITSGKIGTLAANYWSDSDGSESQIDAQSIDRLVVAGSFVAEVDLSSADLSLRGARIGSIEGDTWNISGNIGQIATNEAGANWTANIAGSLGALAANTLSSNITASSIGGIRSQQITNANITLTQAFGTGYALRGLAAGDISGTKLHASDSLGVIRAGSVESSVFAAGIGSANDTEISGAAFAGNTIIRSFSTRAFYDTAVLANTIGEANLGAVQDVLGTLNYAGLSASMIGALRLSVQGATLGGRDINSMDRMDAALRGFSLSVITMVLPDYDGDGRGTNESSDFGGSGSGGAGTTNNGGSGGFAVDTFSGPLTAGTVHEYYDKTNQRAAYTETVAGTAVKNGLNTVQINIDHPTTGQTESQYITADATNGDQVHEIDQAASGNIAASVSTFSPGKTLYPPSITGGIYPSDWTETVHGSDGSTQVITSHETLQFDDITTDVTVITGTYHDCHVINRTTVSTLPGGATSTLVEKIYVASGVGAVKIVTSGTDSSGNAIPQDTVILKRFSVGS